MSAKLTLASVKELLNDSVTCRPAQKKKEPAFGVRVPMFVGTRNVQRDNYNEVYPSIYLGNVDISQNKEALRQIQPTHILNAAQGTKFNQINTNEEFYSDLNIKFLGFPAVDIFTYNMSKHFSEAAEFIEQCLQENGKVVVYCQQGISRSASLVLSFLMLKRGMTLADAIKSVNAKRSISPNDGFLKQLIQLNNDLYGGSSDLDTTEKK